jgi:biotin transport system substrate-specific component
MSQTSVPLVPSVTTRPVGIQFALALAGAIAVAVSAQVAIPVPGSLVPFTLQPLAVLIVGGLLGPRLGALSLVLYLGMGAAGLPVFAPMGVPGFGRLIGPTGGFLIAFPFAAAVTGKLAGASYRSCVLAALAGMAVIFAGGIAQLSLIAPDRVAAMITPFLAADLVKALLAGAVIQRFAPKIRSLS